MDLVRDVLDSLVVDRNGREMGRADGIVIERRDGLPPRVAAIEIGPTVLGHRLHPALGRLIAGIEHAFGVDAGRPVRVGFGDILEVGPTVRVDCASGETGALNVERRLRRVVGKVPGSR
jgi:hypothetical protein